MKKRKYNPERNKQRVAKAVLNRLHAVAVRLQSKVTDNKMEANTAVFNAKTCQQYAPNSVVQTHLSGTRMKWAIWGGVMCVDTFGKQYIQGQWIVANEHYYFDQVQEVVADAVEEVYNDANKNHVIDAGWLAVPWGEEISDKEIIDVFLDYGVWND